MSDALVTIDNLATALGVTTRQTRTICKQGHYRNHPIDVVTIRGRGGRGGVQYAVKVESLPDEIKARLKTPRTPVEGAVNALLDERRAHERNWWRHLLAPALAHPKRSKARGAAFKEIAEKNHLCWDGRYREYSVKALQERARALEESGGLALNRKRRADKGKKRCIVSRAWDKAVPFDEATKREIAERLRDEIRGLIKGGAHPKQARQFASIWLMKVTEKYGFRPNKAGELERICAVPKHLITAERHYKKVYIHKFDRKASEDAAPRIGRTIEGLRPMEIVTADVHHINVLVERPNGKPATPKLIAFEDNATGRIWYELILFNGRGGVRNPDVINLFVRMVTAWSGGVPEAVYCDNGAEYNFADFFEDAFDLNASTRPDARDWRRPRVTRAKPNNAAAKTIEGRFRLLEQNYLRHCPGYIGDDRMNKKQQVIGKQNAPFPGGFEAFADHFASLMKAYENTPQQGQLGGRSPMELFKAHVDAGWRATVLSPEDALTIFAKEETRTVRNQAIRVNGREWTCPELDAYLGDKVIVRIPAYHKFNELLILDENGERLGIAQPSEKFAFHDKRGAQIAYERKKARNGAIRELNKSAPDIDIGERLIEFGEAADEVVPNEPDAFISIDTGGRPAQFITPTPAPDGRDDEAERRHREALAVSRLINSQRRKAS